MLGVQFFLCWLFVALSAALYLQSEKTSGTLLHTLSMQEKASILSIPLDYSCLNNAEKQSLVGRFKSLAAVEDALLADVSYLGGSSGNLMMTEKGNDNSWIEVEVMRVPANFFTFMNIPLEQGRAPKTEADIVADRTWQQRMEKDILGMPLYDSQRDYSVCGICAPFQTDTYSKSIGYVFLLYNPSDYIGHCYLKCHSGQVQEVKARVEQLLREALPESVPVRVGTLLDDIHDRQPLEYTMKNIVLFFAVVSILITLLGVYSSITLDTERRQKEVAIRKVNGAQVDDILSLFAREYLLMLLLAASVAFPTGYVLMKRWLESYVEQTPVSAWIYIVIFAGMALLVALCIGWRTRTRPKW